MSEEEIIKIMKNLILMPCDWKITHKYDGKIDFIGSLEGNEAIQGLLDLYNKEKEKNKKLLKERESNAEKYIYNNPWLYKELNERYVFKADIEKDYTSKDKIREKIKELDKKAKQGLKGIKGQDRYFIKQIYHSKRSSLEELLEEE